MTKDELNVSAEKFKDEPRKYFENLGWKEEDIEIGLIVYSILITILINNPLIPISAPKMPDVLRAVAHIIEITGNELREKGINVENVAKEAMLNTPLGKKYME